MSLNIYYQLASTDCCYVEGQRFCGSGVCDRAIMPVRPSFGNQIPTSMSDPTLPLEPPGSTLPPASDEVLNETIEHAKAGYDNAQNVIKLIDAKAGILIGLSTLAAGFLISVFKWYVELDPAKGGANFLAAVTKHPGFTHWAASIGVLSSNAGLVCIGACVWSVVARPRPSHLNMPFLILFPVYPQSKETEAAEFFRWKLQGMRRPEILIEYEDQLRVLGLILSKKLKHNRVASIAFIVQLCLLALTIVLLLTVYAV